MVTVLARLGATDPYSPALALMACCEGSILHRIARHDISGPRPLLRVVVSAASVDQAAHLEDFHRLISDACGRSPAKSRTEEPVTSVDL